MYELLRAIIQKAALRVFEPEGSETGIDIVFGVAPSDRPEFGHYSTNVALRIAKDTERKPLDIAQELAISIKAAAPKDIFEKIEVAPPGFINFWLAPEAVREEFARIAADEDFGTNGLFKGKRIMVEYTDPNPFKQFHIGHLMTNVIGESIARLYEISGADVLRVNYQGDVGMHVAKALWGMMKLAGEAPTESAPIEKKTKFLGRAYAKGATAYEEDAAAKAPLSVAKAEIDGINKKVYDRSDEKVNALYDRGRAWSLEHFETLYARLGTKFDHYFFESEVGPAGMALVAAHPEVFEKSEGAIIFPGEQYGLHNRVFINAQGLPTYEAKELGLNKEKFDTYHPDRSYIVTANEINEYFRVLLKAMEFVVPEAAGKTVHIGHGMLRLPSGKMSSRTGHVITAEELIDQVKQAVREKVRERDELSEAEKASVEEGVALAAIRYSILKQSFGKDIIFDMEKSVSFHGDSGPYLQYTFARLKSILRKASEANGKWQMANGGTQNIDLLDGEQELALMRKLAWFPAVVELAVRELTTTHIAKYLYELSGMANGYYESTPIIKDEDAARRGARLTLIGMVGAVLERGLGLLGIEALEKI